MKIVYCNYFTVYIIMSSALFDPACIHCVLQEIDDIKATQLSTVSAAGVSGDHSRTLSELYHMTESVPVIMYSLQVRMTCVMCWLRFVMSTIGRSLDCN